MLKPDYGLGMQKGEKPLTNGDRIRAMSDEELAYWFEWRSLCGHIQIEHEELCATRGACGGCVLNWLKQPADLPKKEEKP